MTFDNEKKTYLTKIDQSRKGEIDQKILPLLEKINAFLDYYTTSSCSGRVYLWRGSGKKNETEWLKVSHDLIAENFFDKKFLDKDFSDNIIWLRLEGMILHAACRDILAANKLLDLAHQIYKKSCILSASNKIIVEIRGSEFLEMPFYQEGKLLFSGEMWWLVELINQKMKKIWSGTEKLVGALHPLSFNKI